MKYSRLRFRYFLYLTSSFHLGDKIVRMGEFIYGSSEEDSQTRISPYVCLPWSVQHVRVCLELLSIHCKCMLLTNKQLIPD